MAQSLESLANAARTKGAAPVELWNPPYCGDIGLEICSDGSWQYQGSPIARTALVALFASVLRKDGDGRTYLVTPAEKVDVRVADAPFVAVAMEVVGAGVTQVVRLGTNLDEWVEVGPHHPLRFALQPDGGLKPYVLVRGRLEARVARSIYFDMIALAEAEGLPDSWGLWSGGVWWPLAA